MPAYPVIETRAALANLNDIVRVRARVRVNFQLTFEIFPGFQKLDMQLSFVLDTQKKPLGIGCNDVDIELLVS